MSVKFVIVSAPRTGSTLLVKTLNSLDGIRCHGELFNLAKVRSYQDGFDPFIASSSERQDRDKRLLQARNYDPVGFAQDVLLNKSAATGFKMLYNAFLNPRWNDVTQSLLATVDIRFIHLTRKNSLRRYVSEKILQAGGPNHSQAGGKSNNPLKVYIDINAFLQRSTEIDAEVEKVSSVLENHNVLDISYERLSDNTAMTVAHVCQFLNLKIEPSCIVPALQKVGLADLRDSVSNYQELLENDTTRALLCD